LTDHLAATRASYDAVAADYAELFNDQLAGHPSEQALVTVFADLVRADGNLRVAEDTAEMHQLLRRDPIPERSFGPTGGIPHQPQPSPLRPDASPKSWPSRARAPVGGVRTAC
jgi:hypothetical protein